MRNEKGFTLVEVMVASIVFLIVMIGGMSFFTLGRRPLGRSQEVNFALQYAEDDMEEVKRLGRDLVFDVSTSKVSATGITYDMDRTVVPSMASPLTQCAKVTTEVTWDSPGTNPPEERSISLVTMVTIEFPYAAP